MNKAATVSIAALAFAGAAEGQTYNFFLDGLQEVPANASPATGFGVVTLTAATNMINLHVEFSGLVAPQTAAHIHSAPAGSNGSVVIPLPLGSPIDGNFVLTDAQETALLAGGLYVNIHSSAFPGGEIRGQIVPTPASAALLGLGAVGAWRRRRA